MSLLDIFNPYLEFIVIFISIGLNLVLIFKTGTKWTTILTFNIFVTVILNLVGLSDYDPITIVITSLIDVIRGLIDGIFRGGNIWDLIKGIFGF